LNGVEGTDMLYDTTKKTTVKRVWCNSMLVTGEFNMTKICKVCNLEKDILDFNKQKGQVTYRCKKCLSEYNKKYYKQNQDKIKKQTQTFRENNPEYIKDWRQNNPNKMKKQKRAWLEKHRDLINQKERHKRKTNTEYKIKKNLRRRVNQVITKNNKSDSTMQLIGCSVYQLIKHLEQQFVDNMGWENYGEWHIDHIKPCASFDLNDPEQQKRCFHYTNLQPLWAEDNLRKSDKIL
jgi:hypothetical protein